MHSTTGNKHKFNAGDKTLKEFEIMPVSSYNDSEFTAILIIKNITESWYISLTVTNPMGNITMEVILTVQNGTKQNLVKPIYQKDLYIFYKVLPIFALIVLVVFVLHKDVNRLKMDNNLKM